MHTFWVQYTSLWVFSLLVHCMGILRPRMASRPKKAPTPFLYSFGQKINLRFRVLGGKNEQKDNREQLTDPNTEIHFASVGTELEIYTKQKQKKEMTSHEIIARGIRYAFSAAFPVACA